MITIEEYELRRSRLQKEIAQNSLDAYLVSSEDSIYYLTGASYKPLERPFFIVVWPERAPTLIVPMLEKVHMTKANIGTVTPYWEYPAPAGSGWADVLKDTLGNIKTLGVEPSLTLEIAAVLKSFSPDPLPLVDKMRLVKSAAELEMIKRACHYADLGMQRIMNTSYHGATVLEIFSEARGLQAAVLKDGDYEPLTSSFLTVSWPAPFSSQPHGIPKVDDRLGNGPLVAMSFIRVNGYAAEVERTYFHQMPSEDERELFGHMENARKAAFDLVKPGVNCSEIDEAAKYYLQSKGLSEFLLHRTGHGIGMGNHEGPYVAEGSEDVLEENMVISIEPGIYVPDTGGFRHSDTVLVTNSGAEYLTEYPTDIDSLIVPAYKIFKRLKGKLIRSAVGIK
ncbi:MAG: Xaa-Pro peptidase family protein [Desulfobacteraceae bacterium]|jgi:Xaa-Pro aminopeptidase|nr:Xaa-Pro peptidase family protein [Desulfobacteraceae bacterium]